MNKDRLWRATRMRNAVFFADEEKSFGFAANTCKFCDSGWIDVTDAHKRGFISIKLLYPSKQPRLLMTLHEYPRLKDEKTSWLVAVDRARSINVSLGRGKTSDAGVQWVDKIRLFQLRRTIFATSKPFPRRVFKSN